LEGTFKGHLVQCPCNEQGGLQLDQIAQSPVQPDLECFQAVFVVLPLGVALKSSYVSEVHVKEFGNPEFSLSHILYDRECYSAPKIPECPRLAARRVTPTWQLWQWR